MHRGSLSIDRGINAIYRIIRFILLYCKFLPTGSREEPKEFVIAAFVLNIRNSCVALFFRFIFFQIIYVGQVNIVKTNFHLYSPIYSAINIKASIATRFYQLLFTFALSQAAKHSAIKTFALIQVAKHSAIDE